MKLDNEDGIDEGAWEREMEKPIPTLKPVTRRTVPLRPAAWGEEEEEQSDPRDQFWGDAHHLLSSLRWVIDTNKKLGLLKDLTENLLMLTFHVLDAEFKRGRLAEKAQEENDIPF